MLEAPGEASSPAVQLAHSLTEGHTHVLIRLSALKEPSLFEVFKTRLWPVLILIGTGRRLRRRVLRDKVGHWVGRQRREGRMDSSLEELTPR